MTRPLVRFAALFAFACSGRMSFDTHTLAATGGRAGDESGGLGADAGAPAGGASTGGARADDCGGTHALPSPPDGHAGEPASEGLEELECEESSSCYSCATHLDCAYRWLCDPVLQVCVECLTDQNCPQGTCDVRQRKCH